MQVRCGQSRLFNIRIKPAAKAMHPLAMVKSAQRSPAAVLIAAGCALTSYWSTIDHGLVRVLTAVLLSDLVGRASRHFTSCATGLTGPGHFLPKRRFLQCLIFGLQRAQLVGFAQTAGRALWQDPAVQGREDCGATVARCG